MQQINKLQAYIYAPALRDVLILFELFDICVIALKCETEYALAEDRYTDI